MICFRPQFHQLSALFATDIVQGQVQYSEQTDEMAAFTTGLLEKKKLFPNEVEPMAQFLLMQPGQSTEPGNYQFSKEAEKNTPLHFMKEFLGNLPERLPLDKLKEPGIKTGPDSHCFSKIKPDEENLNLHHQARAIMEISKISYEAALAQLEN